MNIIKMLSGMVLAAGIFLGSCDKKEEKKESAEPRPVDVAEAYTDSVILYRQYPGYLTSEYNADVVGLVNGRILTRNYQEGSYVRQGQVLFTIDPTLYEDAVARAEATLKSNESSLQYAKSHYDAVQKALEADAVSRMEVDQAYSDYLTAQANVNDSRAALHTAKVNLGYCTVTAPISGYISEPVYSVGNYISGGASPVKLAEIYDNNNLYAIFEIEDVQFLSMENSSEGSQAQLKAIPLKFAEKLNNQYTANLVYEAPAVSRSTGTLTLKGKVDNRDNELKTGMYCTVSLPYGENPRAILVKDASIGTDQLGKFMFVVNDSNTVVKKRIETGELYRDSLRVVNKGIEPGEKYITKALLTVRAGEKVMPLLPGQKIEGYQQKSEPAKGNKK